MKKLFFLLILLFSVQVFADIKNHSTETKADNKELQVNLYYKIYIIENVVQEREYQEKSLFSGIDVDKILNDVTSGTGKYSKEARLATEMCERDEKLMLGYYRLFDREELEEIARKSAEKVNKELKSEIRALYEVERKITP